MNFPAQRPTEESGMEGRRGHMTPLGVKHAGKDNVATIAGDDVS